VESAPIHIPTPEIRSVTLESAHQFDIAMRTWKDGSELISAMLKVLGRPPAELMVRFHRKGVGDRTFKAIRVVLPGEFPRCAHGCRMNLLRVSDSLVSSTFSQGLGGYGWARLSETVARSRRDFGVQGGSRVAGAAPPRAKSAVSGVDVGHHDVAIMETPSESTIN
jgi:hypothetical protein